MSDPIAAVLQIPKSPTADTVYYAFGRFQPPTIGHRKVFETMKELAHQSNGDYFIVPSHSCDAVQSFVDIDTPIEPPIKGQSTKKKCEPSKNPLNLRQKLYFLREMYPEDQTHLIDIEDLTKRYVELLNEAHLNFPSPKTFATVAQVLFLCGYKTVYLVVGSDEYESLLLLDPSGKRRKGTEQKKTFVDSIRQSFDTMKQTVGLPDAVFDLKNAGQRVTTDVKADSVASMSGTKMRKAVEQCSFDEFRKGIPETLSEMECVRLFRILRKALGHSKALNGSPCDVSLPTTSPGVSQRLPIEP